MSEDRLLEFFESRAHRGRAPAPTASTYHRHPTCGDEIELSLTIEADTLQSIRFEARGCVVSQAAAAMLCEHLEGKPLAEINAFSPHDMLAIVGLPLSPRRLGCALLAYEALRLLEPFAAPPPAPSTPWRPNQLLVTYPLNSFAVRPQAKCVRGQWNTAPNRQRRSQRRPKRWRISTSPRYATGGRKAFSSYRTQAQLAAGSLISLRRHSQNPTMRSVRQPAVVSDCSESVNADPLAPFGQGRSGSPIPRELLLAARLRDDHQFDLHARYEGFWRSTLWTRSISRPTSRCSFRRPIVG